MSFFAVHPLRRTLEEYMMFKSLSNDLLFMDELIFRNLCTAASNFYSRVGPDLNFLVRFYHLSDHKFYILLNSYFFCYSAIRSTLREHHFFHTLKTQLISVMSG